MSTPTQLSLSLSLQSYATFETYYASPDHALVCDLLKTMSTLNQERRLVLWGPSGAGVSHLLQATCHQSVESGRQVQYVPLKDLLGYVADEVLDGLEVLDLVCLDDLQCVSGHKIWEQALFHFFNRIRDAGGQLVLGLNNSPLAVAFDLPDFQSRVRGCEVYQVAALSDEQKILALRHRAHLLAMDLSEEAAKYLMHHVSRRAHDLFDLLANLDALSLQRQRKLTIPFIKEVLAI